MPTSSIFANVHINDPQKAEAFIDALDEAANSPRKEFEASETSFLINDVDKIREIMGKSSNVEK